MANDDIRTLVNRLNNPFGRSKTLEEINELLKPSNIALNVSGLTALLSKTDDVYLRGNKNKTEELVKRFVGFIESIILNPSTNLKETYHRKGDVRVAMCYARTVTNQYVRAIFDTEECRRLEAYSAYIKLWEKLGHRPSDAELKASDPTPCRDVYYKRFDGIDAMLEKYGYPNNH